MKALADAVLWVHVVYVGFVVLGLILIWLGAWRGWSWVRGFWFRTLHLCAILLVALEALIGMACALTRLEDWLRHDQARGGFIQRWLHMLLYWDLPAWVFTIVYLVFAGVVALMFMLVPPRRRAAI